MHQETRRHQNSVSQAGPEAVAHILSADALVLQKELVALQDRHLRLAADFDNYRKRIKRDSEGQSVAQKEAFIGELLPTLDNLERALATGSTNSSDALRHGVTMILEQLAKLLHRHGIEAAEEEGQPFDPHRQEAVSVQHDPTQPDQVILQVIQRGYRHGDRVLRPAKVVVNDLSNPVSPGARHAG